MPIVAKPFDKTSKKLENNVVAKKETKMILDEIKKANVEAMKNRDQGARAIYSVVMTKAMNATVLKREKGEELTDSDVLQIIQKTIKELTDEEDSYKTAGRTEQAEAIAYQKEVISKYLPKMLSADEIKAIIASLDDKSVPNVMKHFKQNYAGQVDMGLVNATLRSMN